MFGKTAIASAALSGLLLCPAVAQVSAPPPAGSTHVIPEKQGAPIQSGRSESLSSKLSNSGGVIKPRGEVDPKMTAPAPEPAPRSTPVIPPSATGGDTAK